MRRNKKMADGIDEIMQSKPVFVVIGAAHLPYEHGVLSLLEDRGYTRLYKVCDWINRADIRKVKASRWGSACTAISTYTNRFEKDLKPVKKRSINDLIYRFLGFGSPTFSMFFFASSAFFTK
ncbi:TraB/GumN family protein [Parapedobacter sp. DT-150]|uniref:TraB/GumN family protein n=1 Tax=Parapedobacter sp. DT-150 TaxID=3396162 RepID=UPI003F1D067F